MRIEITHAAGLTAAGKPDEAIRILTRLTASNPRDADGWRELGRALLAKGRQRDGLDALMRSTWIIGRDLDTWVTMASVAGRLGLHKDAISYWQSALDIDPALFEKRPELLSAWKHSRAQYNDFEVKVRRLCDRSDLAAAWVLLDGIGHARDAAIALQYLNEGASSRAAQFAHHLLSCVAGQDGTLVQAFDLVLEEDEENREPVGRRCLRWLAKLLRGADSVVANALAERPDRGLARAGWQLAAGNREARAVAARILGCAVLGNLRSINIAA